MRYIAVSIAAFSLIGALGCGISPRDRVAPRSFVDQLPKKNRPGIAVVASGGIAGWEHVTLLDSASARFVTVTRRACAARCALLDSAFGRLTASDVARIYEIADGERVLLQRGRAASCTGCAEDALVTTAVFGNRRRSVIRSDREASPEVLGRVHVAIAEAIRASRSSPGSGEAVSIEP